MKLYPAIDLRGGQAVRLYQGDYDRMTVYNADPVAQAQQFIDAGAKYLHVVDLDGAKDDTTANLQTIAAIAKLGGLKIEVGGGIRDEARIQRYLDLGAHRCILGTVAVKNFDFTAEMAQKYGTQIAVGVDMKDFENAIRAIYRALSLSTAGRRSPPSRAWHSAAAAPMRASRPLLPPIFPGTARCRAPIWRCTVSF